MRIVPICLVSLAVLASGADAQTLYRWVDKDGKVHYSDQPPPKEIRKVEERRVSTSTIETSTPSYDLQQAAQNFPVTLYTTPDCDAACKSAKDYLARRGIPYSEKSLVSNEEIAEFKKRFNAANAFVPAIAVGTQQKQGFDEPAWGGILDAAGYPRSAVPGAAGKPAPAPAGK